MTYNDEITEEAIEQANARLPYTVTTVTEIVDGRQTFILRCENGMETEVHAMVAKLNKKLRKWGNEIRVIGEEIKTTEVKNWFSKKPEIRREVMMIIDAPAVAGTKAKLIGSFERAEEGNEVYVHSLNDTPEEVVRAFKHRWDECDHCKTKRARNQSFLCQTDEGEIVLIGRQCSQAYLGLHPAEILAREGIRKLLGGCDEDGEWIGFVTRYRHTEDLVQKCYMVAKRFGGYSREMRGEFMDNIGALDGWRGKDMDAIRKWYDEHPLKEPLDLNALADYVYAMRGDYGDNLRIALSAEYVRPKRLMLIMSGVGLFVGRAARLKAEAQPEKKKLHLLPGAEKERVTFTGTVVRTAPFTNDFGAVVAITIEGDDGSNCVHFSTKDENPKAGDRVTIRATIKRQDTQKVQTVLTRAEYTPIAA